MKTSIDVTLKTVLFKAGRSEQPGRIAVITLIAEDPDGSVKELSDLAGAKVMIEVWPRQEGLPLDED